MALNTGNDSALAHRANLNIASAVVAKLGTGASDGLIGHVIDQVRASHSIAELASANGMSVVVGAVDTAIARNAEINRPRNDFSAEAARAAQAAGGPNGQRGAGFGYIDAIRANSSARFREIGGSGDGRSGGGYGVSGGSVNAPANGMVTPAYARSFADTGIGGGTLKTFAEVGMDRGTFNQFRNEGFSKAQIVDNARDSKVLGWKGKEDLSIAQHASVEARKAAVGTEQAKTPEERAKRLVREQELERQNEQRPDSDPRKQHDRRFWQRRHQDHLRHDAKAGLGSAWSEPGKAIAGAHAPQDGTMAKEAKKQTASVRAATVAGFEVEPEAPKAPSSNKPASVRTATAKPASPAVG